MAPDFEQTVALAVELQTKGRAAKVATARPPSTGLPAWRHEHAQRLHIICKSMEARLQQGDSLSRCVVKFSRIWDGKAYRCDPARSYRLSEKTLYRLFAQWRRGGELPAAVALRYASGTTKVTGPMLRSFVRLLLTSADGNTCQAYRQLKELRARKPYAFGRRKQLPSYSAFVRNLPAGAGRDIATARKALASAAMTLAKLRLKIEAHTAASVAARPPRKTRRPEFEI